MERNPNPRKFRYPRPLLKLESQIIDPNERLFYAETRLCLQVEAYRAAIVMGWNLAYEHLVRWVFSETERLEKFNDELTTRWVNKAKNTKHEAIDDIDDIGNIKESIFIDVCHKSHLLEKEDLQLLDGALRKRNTYAHPTSSQTANGPIASGHVSELVSLMLRLT